MKDGKTCRTCVDYKTWTKIAKAKAKTEESQKTEEPKKIEPKKIEQTEEWRRENCPADVETLGRHTWTLLHTMAAYYPERPSPGQQESMKSFFKSFSENYPCWFCKVKMNQVFFFLPLIYILLYIRTIFKKIS